MKTIKYLILFFIIFSLLFVSILGVFLYQVYLPQNVDEFDSKTITIEEGMGLTQIADLLKEESLLRNPLLFIVYAYLDGKAGRMQAGIYEIDTPVSAKDLVTVISGGYIGNLVRLTIPEGFNGEQIAEKLVEEGVIDKRDEFLNLVQLSTAAAYEIYNYDFLENISASSLEGFLFPDTYEFKENTDPKRVLDKFLKNFERKASNLVGDYDTLILASLLEREVQTQEDMRLVAGVLNNRLEIGMLLQVDATLVYITGKKTGQLTNRDKLIDSVFNTYKYAGLPPAPIANPGLKAINAVLNPIPSDYLYYLTDLDSKTHFAKTLEEHNKNKSIYLR